MAQAVILGVSGEEGLWLADFQAGTVTQVNGSLSGEPARAASLRDQGVSLVKGIDFALAVSQGSSGAGSVHEANA